MIEWGVTISGGILLLIGAKKYFFGKKNRQIIVGLDWMIMGAIFVVVGLLQFVL